MDNQEMQQEIESFVKKLLEFHEEMEGTTFWSETIMGKLESYHFSDYTGGALDALGDLSGVITKYRGE